MLRGLIPIHEAFKKDFDEIKSFCDLNDIQMYRLDSTLCAVYKLMKFVKKRDRKVINIELAD